MEFANSNYFLLEEKALKKEFLYDLAKRCGFRVKTHKKDGKIYYRLKKLGIPCEHLYSKEERSTFNFLDMADLHIGNSECEVDRIKDALNYAVKQNVDYVFIAGDVLDGAYNVDRKDIQIAYRKQIDMAFSLFRKYPLDIRVIPGNHEFSFDYYGITNPLKLLEMRLQNEGCRFKVYDGYIQDFEMAGVIKRMMHLENYYYQDNVFAVIQRLHEFEEHGGLTVNCPDGVKRPVSFLECGHVHKTAEFYNSALNVYITQPGSFISNQNFYMPFIHVKGEVLDDLRIVRG